MKSTSIARSPSRTSVLARLIESPELARAVQTLPGPAFATLVREIGVEDAGEILALASTEQLVAAFDADLFVSDRAGERETFDPGRFVIWLEVLLEAGDEAAARRMAELSEDFVAQALSSFMLVLDNDALLLRLGQGGDEALRADKALESALTEELDSYLLISRGGGGWDAALTLVLALDRDHREFLERVLDRCAAVASQYVDDLEALAGVLDSAESLAEDVEAEREDRRSRQGYVEPRAARSFLELAKQRPPSEAAALERDPLTRAYFRELERPASPRVDPSPAIAKTLEWLGAGGYLPASVTGLLPASSDDTRASGAGSARLIEAMRLLHAVDPHRFGERLEELAYLTNVVMSGAETKGGRLRSGEATESVLATVAFGADMAAVRAGGRFHPVPATVDELCDVLRLHPADILFRRASAISVERGGAMRIEEGREAFNRGEYYLAHELWEKVWLSLHGGERTFVQGLIQLAAGLHHLQQGRVRPAAGLLRKGLDKVSGRASAEPTDLRVAALTRDLTRLLAELERPGAPVPMPGPLVL